MAISPVGAGDAMLSRLWRLTGFVLLLFGCVTGAATQSPSDIQDPSPHQARFVVVEPGIRVEVLDWRGSGRPLVLLPGYNTAHVFDGFAERLTDTYHVYGITRRGFGASDKPEGGYDAARSADDVLAVLDALGLESPILAGHSIGGQDLTTLGAQHSDRLGGLIYLNSAEDATLGDGIWEQIGVDLTELEDARDKVPDAMKKPLPPDYSSYDAYRKRQFLESGMMFPESELRQLFRANPDGTVGAYTTPGRVRDAIFAGLQKPYYARIRVPVLAFFGRPSMDALFQRYKPRNDQERLAMEQVHAVDERISRKHRRDLQTALPSARVVELPDANLYIFLSNPDEVLREMRAFRAGK